jgi:hypothetical protein
MAETGQRAAWMGREKGFEINEAFRQQEDGHITRGAIAPN